MSVHTRLQHVLAKVKTRNVLTEEIRKQDYKLKVSDLYQHSVVSTDLINNAPS